MQMNCFQLQMPLPLAFLIIHFVLSSSDSVECRSHKLDVASSSFFVLSFSLRIGWNQFCLQLFCHFCASKNCRCRSRDAAWSVSYSIAFGEAALRRAVFALQVELRCISTWGQGNSNAHPGQLAETVPALSGYFFEGRQDSCFIVYTLIDFCQ